LQCRHNCLPLLIGNPADITTNQSHYKRNISQKGPAAAGIKTDPILEKSLVVLPLE